MFDIDRYIEYFNDDDMESMSFQKKSKDQPDVMEMSSSVYDEGLEAFIQDIYKTDFLLMDYMEIVENEVKGHPLQASTIDRLDFKGACAVLTWIVRSDQFSEGALGEAAEDRQLYRVLVRIKSLLSGI